MTSSNRSVFVSKMAQAFDRVNVFHNQNHVIKKGGGLPEAKTFRPIIINKQT
jgi:hypothetical protein